MTNLLRARWALKVAVANTDASNHNVGYYGELGFEDSRVRVDALTAALAAMCGNKQNPQPWLIDCATLSCHLHDW